MTDEAQSAISKRKGIPWWMICPLIFPLTIPVLWPGSLLLVNHIERGQPIVLDSKQWVCTKSRTVPMGMTVGEVCDEYSRRNHEK